MGKKSDHDNVLALLPWFVNESLSDRERDLVQVHLAECAECRIARDHQQSIMEMISEDGEVLPDYRFSMNKVTLIIKGLLLWTEPTWATIRS